MQEALYEGEQRLSRIWQLPGIEETPVPRVVIRGGGALGKPGSVYRCPPIMKFPVFGGRLDDAFVAWIEE
jgi:hypothetical protein